jgi:hypothetical protein
MYSQDRLARLTHLLHEALLDEGIIEESQAGPAMKKVRNVMDGMNQKFQKATERAEKKVMETKKNLMPGTAEFLQQVERVFLEEIRHLS